MQKPIRGGERSQKIRDALDWLQRIQAIKAVLDWITENKVLAVLSTIGAPIITSLIGLPKTTLVLVIIAIIAIVFGLLNLGMGIGQAKVSIPMPGSQSNALRESGVKFRAAFAPAIAFLDKARRHGSDHDRPNASAFLRDAFLSHAAAVEEFRHFLRRENQEAYQKAWNEFCALTHDDELDAVFMASGIDDRDPWSVIEDKIRAILSFSNEESSGEFISMKEAATIAYEQLRACRSIYSSAAEKLGHSPTESRADGTLSWFVYWLPSKIPIWGKHPPSRIPELINPEVFKRGGFDDLGKSFNYYNDRESMFTDLMVKRADLDRLIQSVRNDKLG